jgi:hypothetical protein
MVEEQSQFSARRPRNSGKQTTITHETCDEPKKQEINIELY